MLAGCGRLQFDPTPADAPPDACNFGAWSTPVALTTVNSAVAEEFAPTLSSDGLELVFQSEARKELRNFYAWKYSRREQSKDNDNF